MIRSSEEFPTSGFRPPKNKKGERTIRPAFFTISRYPRTHTSTRSLKYQRGRKDISLSAWFMSDTSVRSRTSAPMLGFFLTYLVLPTILPALTIQLSLPRDFSLASLASAIKRSSPNTRFREPSPCSERLIERTFSLRDAGFSSPLLHLSVEGYGYSRPRAKGFAGEGSLPAGAS
jgi:hypothetical protein